MRITDKMMSRFKRWKRWSRPCITTLCRDPDLSKMLHELCTRYYSPNMAEKVKHFVNKCPICSREKPFHGKNVRPPPEQIYDPHNEPEAFLEADLVGELPSLSSYRYIVTATEVLSVGHADSKTWHSFYCQKALLTNFTEHARELQQISYHKFSAFTLKLLTELKKTARMRVAYATLKHAENDWHGWRVSPKLKQIVNINLARMRDIFLAIMAHNTTYHQTLKCSLFEIFHGSVA